MTAIKKTSLHPLFIFMTFFVILGLAACTGTKGPMKVTLDNGETAFQIKGKVDKISRTRNLLTIRPLGGETITFKVVDSTIFEAAESLDSIKRDMPVLVTYSPDADADDEEGNTAIIIKRLPDGSCG
ncbi:MAG: hypothetical protein K9K37_11930 [Desulfocapsa sp.]|nr:hypothetical protein [Desulfocapsa sp.]